MTGKRKNRRIGEKGNGVVHVVDVKYGTTLFCCLIGVKEKKEKRWKKWLTFRETFDIIILASRNRA